MEEIKAILNKHNIAGMIVIHTPGFSEYLLKIDPSYSCAKIEGDHIRVKANLVKDFSGDKKAFEFKAASTSNMFNLLSNTSADISKSLIEISKAVDKKLDAEHFGDGHTSHIEQNN